MRPVWAIARLEIKECLRSKIIYVIGALTLLFILLGRGCNAGNSTTVNASLLSEEARQNISVSIGISHDFFLEYGAVRAYSIRNIAKGI